MAHVIFEAVDAGTLAATRNITALVDASDSVEVSYDVDSDIVCSGSFQFAGNATLLLQLVRAVLVRDDGTTEPLGTFFADTSEASRVGALAQGTIQLEGVLAELRDTCTPVNYVCPVGTSSIDIIRDVCAILGRPAQIPDSLSGGAYQEVVCYEAGSSYLSIAQEAAARAGMRLSQDRMGFITLVPQAQLGSDVSWILAEGDTDITSMIEKKATRWQAPTRVVATWSNADKTLSATADAPERGARQRDLHLSVSDLSDANVAVLAARAQQELEARGGLVDEWSFDCVYRYVEPGTRAHVDDLVDAGRIDGIVSNITFAINPVLTMSVTIRGVAA